MQTRQVIQAHDIDRKASVLKRKKSFYLKRSALHLRLNGTEFRMILAVPLVGTFLYQTSQ